MLKIQKFVFNPLWENTYLIWDEESKNAAIIDPGCYDDNECSELKRFIENSKMSLLYIINTHCHIDHICGNAFVKNTFGCKLIVPEKDLFLFDLMEEQANMYNVKIIPSPKPDSFIADNDEIKLGSSSGKFIFTPGHTPGEYCLYFEKDKVCFTGDVLFKESIGRTDLWDGNYDELMDSIRSKLLVLPDDVTIYPGHESFSTIGYERKKNLFLNGISDL
jgi:hydroxyacylglutathione hydrolase